jgi:8-oxo-dGTP pyrophosphatase MutT (NUDIX family)
MKGRKPYEAAAQEALEEAGVTGQAKKKPIGTYTYFKRREAHFDVCRVSTRPKSRAPAAAPPPHSCEEFEGRDGTRAYRRRPRGR